MSQVNPEGRVVAEPRVRPNLFCDWRFWAMVAGLFPVTLGTGLLQWFYMVSLASYPSGAIVYAAACLHLAAVVWAIILQVHNAKAAKLARQQGVRLKIRYLQIFCFAAAMVSCAAPATVIGVRAIIPENIHVNWVQLANWKRHKDLGF